MLTIFPSVSRSGSGDFLSVAVLSSCGANCCSVTGSVPQFWHWYFQYFSKPTSTNDRMDSEIAMHCARAGWWSQLVGVCNQWWTFRQASSNFGWRRYQPKVSVSIFKISSTGHGTGYWLPQNFSPVNSNREGRNNVPDIYLFIYLLSCNL